MFSSGNSPVRSWCSALGAIFSCAMRRATSWIINCSSVNLEIHGAPSSSIANEPSIVPSRGALNRHSRASAIAATPL